MQKEKEKYGKIPSNTMKELRAKYFTTSNHGQLYTIAM
jgi:hypothetical protein